MEYFSAMKKKEILPFAIAWMNLESIMLTEVSQSQKRQVLYDFIAMRNLTNKMNYQAK